MSSSQQCIIANATITGTPHVCRNDFHRNNVCDYWHYFWGSNREFNFSVPGKLPHTFYTY
jgi:hypothetical protein